MQGSKDLPHSGQWTYSRLGPCNKMRNPLVLVFQAVVPVGDDSRTPQAQLRKLQLAPKSPRDSALLGFFYYNSVR